MTGLYVVIGAVLTAKIGVIIMQHRGLKVLGLGDSSRLAEFDAFCLSLLALTWVSVADVPPTTGAAAIFTMVAGALNTTDSRGIK